MFDWLRGNKKRTDFKASGGGDFRAQITMGLTHTEAQRADVAAALEEFIDAHPGKTEDPKLTITRDGSVIAMLLLVKDSAEAMELHRDLQRRTIAHGIQWEN
jgi:hypothetical protein